MRFYEQLHAHRLDVASWEELGVTDYPSYPSPETMVDWIERVVAQGVRRPGYPADVWTEAFIHDEFRRLGLESVRFEETECAYWEDRSGALTVHDEAGPFDCFPVPLSEPGCVDAPLAAWDPADPAAVSGKIAVYDVMFFDVPEGFPVARRREADTSSSADPLAAAGWAYDPADTFRDGRHRLPFPAELQRTMEPAIAAGAVGFVGVLRGYPGGGCRYYVPYDGEPRPIPGVYVNERDGDRLTALLRSGTTLGTITVDAVRATTTTRNVVGELAGADEDWVVIGTHHDAPWASAVEDGSGIALLLAQAAAWASVVPARRPHRLVFLASGAHMAAGAGTRSFIARHRTMLERIVVELHLEHAALDTSPHEGSEMATGRVAPRWWFTTEIPSLEQAVWQAIVANQLDRSLVLTPTALDSRPTTDGGYFHEVGVPLVNYLAAPWYLFDPADTIDKIDRPTLTALTRAAFEIVSSTAGTSPAEMRAMVKENGRGALERSRDLRRGEPPAAA